MRQKIKSNKRNTYIVQHVIWPIDQDKWSLGWVGVTLQHTSQPKQTLPSLDTQVWRE